MSREVVVSTRQRFSCFKLLSLVLTQAVVGGHCIVERVVACRRWLGPGGPTPWFCPHLTPSLSYPLQRQASASASRPSAAGGGISQPGQQGTPLLSCSIRHDPLLDLRQVPRELQALPRDASREGTCSHIASILTSLASTCPVRKEGGEH